MYDGNRTPTVESDLHYDDRIPTARSNLEDKIVGDLQRAKGNMVTKEFQVIQIVIYTRFQQ